MADPLRAADILTGMPAPPRLSSPRDDERPSRSLLAQWPALKRAAPALHLIEHILNEDGNLLERWRARLTAVFLAAAATLGLVPTVATIVTSLRDGVIPLAVLDAVLMTLVYWLLLSRRASNHWRNLFLAVSTFSIGVMAIVTLGPFSTALSWLLLSTFLATFLIGPRAAIVVVCAVTIVLLGVALGIERNGFAWVAEFPGSATRWMLTSLDFFFLTVIFAGANSLILHVLEQEDEARSFAEARLAEGRRNEALGTLAGGIAHDFNNLLVPILANVESVRASMPAEGAEQQALSDAHRSAERARDLVQRILAFGRGVDSMRGDVAMCVIARDVIELARLTQPDRARLSLECSESPTIHASVAEMHQVIHNLVTNGLHATERHGEVHVDVRTIVRNGQRWAQLRVTDTGVGMDDETRERIFDPYFSTRDPDRGTGLGLPIVRSIVTSLGGELAVESRIGEGSTFTVRLPAAVAHGTPPRDVPTPVRATGPMVLPPGLRVLVVDDEASVRRATARMAQSLGCTVEEVDGAAAALAVLGGGDRTYDIVLTDHRMPGQSGLELIGALRDRHPLLPAVLMSGHIESATQFGAIPTGVTLLQKPFARAELSAAMLTARGAMRADCPEQP